jgi:hypothetical protein
MNPAVRRQFTRFVEEHWERTPALLPRSAVPRVIDEEQAFRVLTKAGEAYRGAGTQGASFRYYKGVKPLYFMSDRDVAERADRTLDRYAARMARRFSPSEFGIILAGAQRHDWALWLTLRDLVSSVYAVVGVSSGHIDPTLFLGNYGSTPFGVHRDAAGVLFVVIKGERTVHLWEPEYWTEHAKSHSSSLAAHLPSATTITARAGDVIYWPSRLYHVIVSRGFSAALSVGVFLRRNLNSDRFGRFVSQALTDSLAADGIATYRARKIGCGGCTDMAQQFRLGVRAISRQQVIANAARAEWLQKITSLGLDPPQNGITEFSSMRHICEADRVRIDRRYPFLWTFVNGRLALCAGNGVLVPILRDSGMLSMLTALNSGRTFRVRSLLDEVMRKQSECRTSVARSECLTVLSRFHAGRQIMRVGSRMDRV